MHRIKTQMSRMGTVMMAMIYALVPMLGLLLQPQAAHALSGTGGASDPYVITTCAELQALDNSDLDRQGDVYSLGNDIDCSMTNPSDPDYNPSGTWSDEQGFDPISGFEAVFDGKGHTISGIYEHRMNGAYVGLFDNAPPLVTNLHIDSTSQFIGASTAGSIAAELYYRAVEGVTSAATVTSTGGPVGGLVGQTYGDTVIFRNDSFTGNVTNNGNNTQVGGLIGRSIFGFDISDSYVNATFNGGIATGGIIGDSGFSNSCASRVMANVYANGVINTGFSGYAGGLFGQYETACNTSTKQIYNSFSTITKGTGFAVYGGIIGASSTDVQIANTYFDQTNIDSANCLGSTSGSPDISTCTAVNADGLDGDHFKNTTSVEPMYDAPGGSEDGWNFTNTWQTASGELPTLRSFTGFTGPGTIQNLVLTPQASAKVNIAFDAVDSWGGFPEGYYIYQMKKSSESWDGNLIDNSSIGNSTQTLANTYLPSTSIDVRVAAVSRYGRSPWTTMTTTTLPSTVHQISNCADLQAIDDVEDQGILDTYVLTRDIDCTGVDFEPIGRDSNGWDDSSFRGTFDGQGHTISNLTIDRSGDWEVGLFYELNGATVRNLSLRDGTISGYSEVGSVAGYQYNGGSITNVTSNLTIAAVDSEIGGMLGYSESDVDGGLLLHNVSYTGDITADGYYIGGLIGYNETYEQVSTTISNSSATGTITTTGGDIGGLIGYTDLETGTSSINATGLYISNSYSQMDIEAEGYTGGLIGEYYTYNNSDSKQIRLQIDKSYAAGNINSTDYASGFIGYVDGLSDNQSIEINDSFAAVTGLDNGPNYALISGDDYINDGSLTFANTYFDNNTYREVAGPADAAYDSTAGTTAVTDDANYFRGNHANQPMSIWDFVNTWGTVDAGYPVLHPVVDVDTDGVSNTIESAAPNGGDANNDGLSDAFQNNVTSFVDPLTGKYAVVQTSCSANSNVSVTGESSDKKDSAYDYPAGLVDFSGVSCATSNVTVTHFYYGSYDPSKLSFRKFRSGAYTTVSGAVMTNETIGGLPVLKVVYTITDGGSQDDDGKVNGEIKDPAGPATLVVSTPNTGLQEN